MQHKKQNTIRAKMSKHTYIIITNFQTENKKTLINMQISPAFLQPQAENFHHSNKHLRFEASHTFLTFPFPLVVLSLAWGGVVVVSEGEVRGDEGRGGLTGAGGSSAVAAGGGEGAGEGVGGSLPPTPAVGEVTVTGGRVFIFLQPYNICHAPHQYPRAKYTNKRLVIKI